MSKCANLGHVSVSKPISVFEEGRVQGCTAVLVVVPQVTAVILVEEARLQALEANKNGYARSSKCSS